MIPADNYSILLLIIHLWIPGVILRSQIFVGIPIDFKFRKKISVMYTLRSHKTPDSVVKPVSINCNNQAVYINCTDVSSVDGRFCYNVVKSIIINGRDRIFKSSWKVPDAILIEIKK